MNEVVITPDTERLTQAYDTLHDPPTAQTGDDVKLSLKNVSPIDIPKLNVTARINTRVIKLQKSNVFCKEILQHIGCSKFQSYFQDATGILHKNAVDFISVCSAIVATQILIKYLLHASHDSLGHVGATTLYNFLK